MLFHHTERIPGILSHLNIRLDPSESDELLDITDIYLPLALLFDHILGYYTNQYLVGVSSVGFLEIAMHLEYPLQLFHIVKCEEHDHDVCAREHLEHSEFRPHLLGLAAEQSVKVYATLLLWCNLGLGVPATRRRGRQLDVIHGVFVTIADQLIENEGRLLS